MMRRHPGDAIRVALAVAILVGTLAAAGPVLSASEIDAFRLCNDLPRVVTPVALALLGIGSPFGLAVAVVVTGLARRFRLLAELVIIEGLSFGAVLGLRKLADRPDSVSAVPGLGELRPLVVPAWMRYGHGFPSLAVTVVAVVAATTAPHVRRPIARGLWAGVCAIGLARIYGGLDLPLDVVAGLSLGWALGAAGHAIFGAPTGHPGLERVAAALAGNGCPVDDLEPAERVAHYALFRGRLHDGGAPVVVKVLGREERSADLLYRAARFLAFREVEDELAFRSRRSQVEHEAFATMVADRAGVHVPAVVMARKGVHGSAILVEERPEGATLDRFAPEQVSDAVLHEVWRAVHRLHAAGIAHRDLRRHNVLIDRDDGVCLLNLFAAEPWSSPGRRHRDLAQLLVSTSAHVGAERAAATAVDVFGSEAASALPFLQPLAIAPTTLRELRGRFDVIGDLRSRLAELTGADDVPLRQMTRVRPRTIIALLALGFAIHLLLPQIGTFHQTWVVVRRARWYWLAIAAVPTALTYVMAALAQRAAVEHRLRLLPMTVVQLACSFTNRVTPAGTGGLGLNERYLEKSGIERRAAVAAVGLNALAGAVVHALGVAVAIAALGRAGIGGAPLPKGWTVLVAVVVAFGLAGIVSLHPLGRRLFAWMRAAAGDLWRAARDPRRASELFGGSAGVTAGYAFALAASLAAFGAKASLADVFVVYLGGAAVASVSPTPGSLGAVEAALLAGLTGVGVAAGPAVAGILAFRLLTFWLPTVPGFVAFRTVRRRQWV
jgi:undecaprenyl-diphosphatase